MAANLLLNPSFEVGSSPFATYWSNNSSDDSIGTQTVENDATAAFGLQYQRITLNVPAGKSAKMLGFICDHVAGFSAGDPATAGFSLRAPVALVGCAVRINLYAYTAADGYLGYTAAEWTVTADWARYSHTYASLPANTAKVRASVQIALVDTGDTGTLDTDGAKLEKSSTPTPFLDATPLPYLLQL